MADTITFPGMRVISTPYKQVKGQDILVGLIIPTALVPGKYPIIVRFHGGFLFTGGYGFWFQPWLIEYAKHHSAIIIGVDYRLMPEHNGLDMMEDLKDLRDWMFTNLHAHLDSGIEADLNKILIEGDSAGGYLAVQFALDLGSKAKALLAVYPPLDLKTPFFTVASERSMVGFPMYPADTVDKHMKTLNGDEVVSSIEPPSRLDLGFSAIQQGNFVHMLGSDPVLFPMERLDHILEIPSMMILHGREDSAVPFRSSEVFVQKLKKLHPNVKVHYKAVIGCEHGLDSKETMETPWLKEGLDFITPLWLD